MTAVLLKRVYIFFAKTNTMRKIMSTKYSAGAFSTAMLLLRLVFGILLVNHGYGKLVHFRETAQHMPNFLHLGQTATTAMVVFARIFLCVVCHHRTIHQVCMYTGNHLYGLCIDRCTQRRCIWKR